MLLQLLHGDTPSSVSPLPRRGAIHKGHHPTVDIRLDGGGGGPRRLLGRLVRQEARRGTITGLGGGRHLGDDRQLDGGGAGGGGSGAGGRSGRSAVAGIDWIKVVEVGGGVLKLVLDPQCHRCSRLLLLLHFAQVVGHEEITA